MTDMSVKEQRKLMAEARAARMGKDGTSETKSDLAGLGIRFPKKKKNVTARDPATETNIITASPLKRPAEPEPAPESIPKKLKTVMGNETNSTDWAISKLLKETGDSSGGASPENRFWAADFDGLKFLYDHLNATTDVNKLTHLGSQQITKQLSSYLMRCVVLTRSLFESGDHVEKQKTELEAEVKRLTDNEQFLLNANNVFKNKLSEAADDITDLEKKNLEASSRIKTLEDELAQMSTKFQDSEKSCSELKDALKKSQMSMLDAGDLAFDRAKAQVNCLYPDIDISGVDYFKTIVDGKLVEVEEDDSETTISEENSKVDANSTQPKP